MKKITIFLFLTVVIGCNKKRNCDDNRKAREIETANIIQTLIDSSGENTLPICTSLKKLKIRTDLKVQMKNKNSIVIVKLPPKNDIISRNTEVFIEKLMEKSKENKSFFNKKDFLNFVQQNQCLYNKFLPEKIKTKTISLAKLESKKLDIEYIIISVPIFSSDNRKAYIEIDTYTKIYNHGESFFFRKNWKDMENNSRCRKLECLLTKKLLPTARVSLRLQAEQ